MISGPVLRYPGAKWVLADWIISHFPAHHSYCEPFFGSGAVFLQKPVSRLETLNDLDGDVVNLFQVIRHQPRALADAISMTPWARAELEASYEPCDKPVERARRWLVRCWIGRGDVRGRAGWRHDVAAARGSHMPVTWRGLPERLLRVADRLRDAQIENRPALEVIQRFNRRGTLLYIDPPYPLETRSQALYRYEMTDADHQALLEVLLGHPSMIVLSGYACALYDDALGSWRRVTARAFADHGGQREEVLWINPAATAALEDSRSQAALLELRR